MRIPKIGWWVALSTGTLIVGLLHAARGPVVMQKPQVQSLVMTPLFDDTGKLQALHVVGTYQVLSLNPDGLTRTKHLTNLDIDLVQHAKTTVGVGSEIVVMGEQAEEILMLAEAIWLHRFPPPLPKVRQRKAQRENLQLPPTEEEKAKMSQPDNLRR